MERARGLRRVIQSLFFPDCDGLIVIAEQLNSRVDQLSKNLVALEKTVDQVDKGMVQLDYAMNQVDKGMGQLDNGMEQLDKEMVVLNKGVGELNKGLGRLNKDVNELEKDLNSRIATLKAKLEAEHRRALGELASLGTVEPFLTSMVDIESLSGSESEPSEVVAAAPVQPVAAALVDLAPPAPSLAVETPKVQAESSPAGERTIPTKRFHPIGPWRRQGKAQDERVKEPESPGRRVIEDTIPVNFAALLEEISSLRNGD